MPDKIANNTDFLDNRQRGTSCLYGRRPVLKLLRNARLTSLIRAHEVQPEGYKFHMPDREGNPAVITIFSAPNYCGQYGNKGALFVSRPTAVDILTFEENQEKPVSLQMEGPIDPRTGEPQLLERVDGISYCMDKLIGYSTQVLLGMFMMGEDPLGRALSSSQQNSTDSEQYKRAIAFESYKQD